ncbi:hypothetical protein, partial [Pseudomonas helleri]|uniref:hypothetical protein n=1 Tax=Pseudomonas helleri TaxID=1608996 RepID=UPI001E64E4C2
ESLDSTGGWLSASRFKRCAYSMNSGVNPDVNGAMESLKGMRSLSFELNHSACRFPSFIHSRHFSGRSCSVSLFLIISERPGVLDMTCVIVDRIPG